MNFALTNPWGLLGLLGIHALILIYYLRRRAQAVTISTLFLLQKSQRETVAGRRFETFSNTLPFWLQLLAILLLTWILTQPQYGGSWSTRQIALVLDSSASMQALRNTLPADLAQRLPEIQGSSDHASYLLLDHDPRRPRLYQGDDSQGLLDSLKTWNPTDGALDPRPSLRIARSLVGPDGLVIYLTDHDGPPLPLSTQRLALGTPAANVGFTGVEVVNGTWSAILKNYSDTDQPRTWTLETPDRRRTAEQKITIPARRFITLKGEIPASHDRCLLRLSPDPLEVDNVLPLISPQPQVARLSLTKADHLRPLYNRMIKGFAHLKPATQSSNLTLTTFTDPQGPDSDQALIADATLPASETTRPTGRLLSENHPLVTGLNWQALSTGPLFPVTPTPNDTPLVFLDDQPLILLRKHSETRAPQLIFNFSLTSGNALKLPATAVLLHRFCEQIARETLTPSRLNLETSQLLAPHLPTSLTAENLTIENQPAPANFASTLRAPAEPGFISVQYQNTPLLDAAVSFADTREADLSAAATTNLSASPTTLANAQIRKDTLWRWFALAIILLALLSWYLLIK